MDKAEANAHGLLVSWWAARLPDRPALITTSGDRTFAELNANINRLAKALRSRGLTVGDSVALMCTNRPEFVEVLLAAQRAGLRLTPINWHLTGEEAGYIVDNCEAKAFVTAASLGEKAVVAASSAHLPNRRPYRRSSVPGWATIRRRSPFPHSKSSRSPAARS